MLCYFFIKQIIKINHEEFTNSDRRVSPKKNNSTKYVADYRMNPFPIRMEFVNGVIVEERKEKAALSGQWPETVTPGLC